MWVQAAAPEPDDDDDDQGGPADEDLYASTALADYSNESPSASQAAGNEQGLAMTRPGGFGGPTVFASMSLGMNHAVLQINKAFLQLSMRAQHRRRLTRPT